MKEKIISVLKTLLFMCLTTVAMMLLLSMLFYKVHISDMGIRMGAIATYLVTNFVGGFIFGKVNEKRKYLYGIIIGIIYFVLLVFATIIFGNGKEVFTITSIISLICCTVGGMLGGMLSN